MNFKIVFLSIFFLSGCATTATECDPSNTDASLFAKLSCDTSGGYRQNITINEQQLQRNQEINRLTHQILADTETRKQRSNQTLSQEKADLQSVKDSVGVLIGKLKSSTGNHARLQQQIDDLAAAEQRFKPSTSDSAAQVEAKKKEAVVLEAKVKQLSESLGY
jgi:hypothetical protein